MTPVVLVGVRHHHRTVAEVDVVCTGAGEEGFSLAGEVGSGEEGGMGVAGCVGEEEGGWEGAGGLVEEELELGGGSGCGGKERISYEQGKEEEKRDAPPRGVLYALRAIRRVSILLRSSS